MDESEADDCTEEISDCIPMFVLSNKSRLEGAACMLYPDVLHDFAERTGSSFYIIPSSIHELLLLSAGHNDESGNIRSMIREVNDTQVSREEILSYSVYFFDKEQDKVVML